MLYGSMALKYCSKKFFFNMLIGFTQQFVRRKKTKVYSGRECSFLGFGKKGLNIPVKNLRLLFPVKNEKTDKHIF